MSNENLPIPTLQPSAPPPGYPRKHRRRARHKRWMLAAVLFTVLLVFLVLFLWKPWSVNASAQDSPDQELTAQPLTKASAPPIDDGEDATVMEVEVPEWVTVNLLPVNEYSRPGTPLTQVNGVVVHYVGNPGTTAEQNRSYYASLAETHENWASSHFVIGMDGTVIQCVPLSEIAYCSNDRNADTISIECCHPDSTGAFTQDTLDALAQLLNWLIDTYSLEREDILRHYDVTGKECPRYFVVHPDAWEDFLDALTF